MTGLPMKKYVPIWLIGLGVTLAVIIIPVLLFLPRGNPPSCHPDAAAQIMKTTHWTWESEPFNVPWRDQPVTIGKINQINNFCIGAQGNQKQCMSCHSGYGWQEDAAYDFGVQENVDCLACHADPPTHPKG